MAKETVKQDEKWEVEDAARTLQKAEGIKYDATLYKKALTYLEEQQVAIDKVLREHKVEKITEGKNTGKFRSKRS